MSEWMEVVHIAMHEKYWWKW